jgi:hypothetical protein
MAILFSRPQLKPAQEEGAPVESTTGQSSLDGLSPASRQLLLGILQLQQLLQGCQTSGDIRTAPPSSISLHGKSTPKSVCCTNIEVTKSKKAEVSKPGENDVKRFKRNHLSFANPSSRDVKTEPVVVGNNSAFCRLPDLGDRSHASQLPDVVLSCLHPSSDQEVGRSDCSAQPRPDHPRDSHRFCLASQKSKKKAIPRTGVDEEFENGGKKLKEWRTFGAQLKTIADNFDGMYSQHETRSPRTRRRTDSGQTFLVQLISRLVIVIVVKKFTDMLQ